LLHPPKCGIGWSRSTSGYVRPLNDGVTMEACRRELAKEVAVCLGHVPRQVFVLYVRMLALSADRLIIAVVNIALSFVSTTTQDGRRRAFHFLVTFDSSNNGGEPRCLMGTGTGRGNCLWHRIAPPRVPFVCAVFPFP